VRGVWPLARSGRRTIRLRLTITYSALFLIAAAMLIMFTYVLVFRGLSVRSIKPTNSSVSFTAFKNQCNKALAASKVSGAVFADRNLIARCEQGFTSGVAAGAASQRAQAMQELLFYSLVGLGVMGVLSGAAGWLVAGRALQPVHAITGAARRASEANLGERLALNGPNDELKELADTYDAMLARLDAAFASQRRFVANASHELRTPLTVMRTAIDVTLAKPGRTSAQLEDMAVEVRHAVDRAESLIEALLTLARSDRGTAAREQTDLSVLAEDALDAAAPAIRAGSLHVETALRAAPTSGDSVLLDRLVANLVDNAVRHNPAGGWIQVATGMRGDAAFLAVSNGGPRIPDELAPELFEPFRRLDDRGGTAAGAGLGLSIVRSVAHAHHGDVIGRPRPAGGLEVSVLLPGDPARAEPGPAPQTSVLGPPVPEAPAQSVPEAPSQSVAEAPGPPVTDAPGQSVAEAPGEPVPSPGDSSA
jgi:signal transduction histidine kinase